jgi:hypothetical protein
MPQRSRRFNVSTDNCQRSESPLRVSNRTALSVPIFRFMMRKESASSQPFRNRERGKFVTGFAVSPAARVFGPGGLEVCAFNRFFCGAIYTPTLPRHPSPVVFARENCLP